MKKESIKTPIFKVVVIGQERVGKTSIATKFCSGKFDPQSPSTVDACCLEKYVNLSATKRVMLSIWDTAGQQKYNAIVPVYYRDALGAIIVYQITSIESFKKVKKWIQQLKNFANKDLVICVVGNKTDLKNQRKVFQQEAEKYCKEQNVDWYEVSAKTGEGIQELFIDMACKIQQKQSQSKMVFKGSRNPHYSKISLQKKQQQIKRGCCR